MKKLNIIAFLKRSVFKCFLNKLIVSKLLRSNGSSFQSLGAATEKVTNAVESIQGWYDQISWLEPEAQTVWRETNWKHGDLSSMF